MSIYMYIACGLTMAIESAYFLLVGYRRGLFLLLCLAANMASNLTLNLFLSLNLRSYWLNAVLVLELLAVAFEYVVYRLALGRTKKLLLHTLAANALSFTIGAVLLILFLNYR